MSSFAQSKKIKATPRGERLITALVNSKTLNLIWGDDGFGNGTRFPEVIRIFRLGKRAIPLLIKHLDDRRVIRGIVRADQSNQTGVTVGEGVLDLLESIVPEQAPVFDMACVKDEGRNEDRCVARGFNFGRRGKRNWLKAYRAGKIHYQKSEY